MYFRPPNNKNAVKLPENYSGSVFSRHSQYSEMPPPIRTQAPRQDIHPFDLPVEEMREDVPQYQETTVNESIEEQEDIKDTDTRSVGSSIFSSLLPRGNLSSHFPFGHGIGTEELLILAVMLLVFLSGNENGEVDSEFLLLLGLLLFAG